MDGMESTGSDPGISTRHSKAECGMFYMRCYLTISDFILGVRPSVWFGPLGSRLGHALGKAGFAPNKTEGGVRFLGGLLESYEMNQGKRSVEFQWLA